MAVCQNLEGCAHHVMVVWEITKEENRVLGVDELRAVATRLKDVPLGRTSRKLRTSVDFGAEGAEVLEQGRIARNWLAHESTLIIDEQGDMRDNKFMPHITEFGKHVRCLCKADSMLAIASYEIQEREPISSGFGELYARRVETWVLDPISSLLASG